MIVLDEQLLGRGIEVEIARWLSGRSDLYHGFASVYHHQR
jgi:hypothetical protein